MNSGFRGWLYRFISALFGLVGLFFALTLVELDRFFGFSSFATLGWVSLIFAFLLFMSSFFSVWAWKKYLVSTIGVGAVIALVYLALRPEMIRNDLLSQYKSPPLSVDLLFYRGMAIRNDVDRDKKIERLAFFYGFLKSFNERTNAGSHGSSSESK